MAHRAGHSLVPEFSFPQSWEVASQALPGFMSPENYRRLGRGLLDFVPGVSTALNWPQMGPWGRTASVGMDVADLLTGGMKGGAGRAFLKFLRRNDASRRFLRFGEVPTSAGWDPATGRQFPGGVPVPSRSNLAFPEGTDPRASYLGLAEGKREPGVSVYQTLFDPNTGKYVLKDAPPSYTMGPENLMNPHGEWRFGAGQGLPYRVNPMATQDSLINTMVKQYKKSPSAYGRREDWPFYRTGQPYEVRGNPLSDLGSDLEPQLWNKSINLPTGQTYVSPTQIVRQGAPNVNLLGETLSNVPNVSFNKYDEFGNRILTPFERSLQGADLPWTLPWTTGARSLPPMFPSISPKITPTNGFVEEAFGGTQYRRGSGLPRTGS